LNDIRSRGADHNSRPLGQPQQQQAFRSTRTPIYIGDEHTPKEYPRQAGPPGTLNLPPVFQQHSPTSSGLSPRSPSRFPSLPRHAYTHYQQNARDDTTIRRHRQHERQLKQSHML